MVDKVPKKLVDLYQQMYELTKPECDACRLPHSCCSPEYCHLAMKRAADFGISLTPTGHDKLPLMGAAGCVAPPHLRPLCTLHTCDMSGLGFKRDDPLGKWNDDYFKLRDEINEIEYEIYINKKGGSTGSDEDNSPVG